MQLKTVVEPLSIHREARFGLLCQAAFDAVLVHRAGIISAVSEKCARLFGCTEADMVGRSILDFTAPEMHQRVMAHTLAAVDTPFEAMGRKASGEPIPLQICGISHPGSDERIVVMRDLTAIRKVEQEVKDREARLRVLAEAAFDGIIVEREGIIVECNHAFAEMFGTDHAALPGKPLASLLDADVAGEILRLQPGQSLRKHDVLLITPDERLLTVEICTGVIDTDQRVIAVRDVSQWRLAQRRIEESEDRYRDLIDNTHDLICTHDLEGRILSANLSVSRLLAIPKEDLVGLNVRDILDRTIQGEFEQFMRVLMATGLWEGKMRVMARDGRVRIWEFRNTLHSEPGRDPLVRWLARDVTDREEAVAGLRRSEALFRSIIETTSDLVGILDSAGSIRYHSPSVERSLGYSSEELTGNELLRFVHADDADRLRAAIERQIADCSADQTIAVRLRRREGSWRSFEIVMKNVVRGTDVESIVVSARDITDRQLLEAQLAQAQRLNSLGRLAATVAHEFNNVLMGMQPFAELLQRSGLPLSTHVRSAQHIANSIQRGKRVALDILRFTQPAVPAMHALDVAAWWKHLLPELQAQTPSHITFTSSFPEGIYVSGDGAQLTQVFSNLISNARDAMPKRGSLTVTARLPQPGESFSFGIVADPAKFVQISVRDDGIGISPDLIGHVFEPLVTTKENGGTGLGLAVAHQVITRHGGHIFVESQPGEGTIFHVFLQTVEGSSIEEKQEKTGQPTRMRTLVLVEDEPAIIEGLTVMLAGEGITVHAVQTGGEAADAVSDHCPDSVLIDLGLPDMDGDEVGSRLRKAHPELPIIYATGHGDRHLMRPDRFARFLQKPFEMGDLMTALVELEEATSQSRAVRP